MKDKALKKVKAKCKQLCKEQGGSNKYLTYGEDTLTELSVTLKYDWARLQTAGQSIATANAGDSDFFTP